MQFYDLFEYAQIKAIESAISPSLESIWRSRCRLYSQKYHTPLHIVEDELDPLRVLGALYEDQYPPSIVNEELQELLDTLQKIKDPNYSRMTQAETEELVDAVLNRELARAAKKKPPNQQEIQNEIVKEVTKPKSGSMDFGDLEKLESESENKGFSEI